MQTYNWKLAVVSLGSFQPELAAVWCARLFERRLSHHSIDEIGDSAANGTRYRERCYTGWVLAQSRDLCMGGTRSRRDHLAGSHRNCLHHRGLLHACATRQWRGRAYSSLTFYIAVEGVFELLLFSRWRGPPETSWFLVDGIVSSCSLG
jgi:hypothetical protein